MQNPLFLFSDNNLILGRVRILLSFLPGFVMMFSPLKHALLISSHRSVYLDIPILVFFVFRFFLKILFFPFKLLYNDISEVAASNK